MKTLTVQVYDDGSWAVIMGDQTGLLFRQGFAGKEAIDEIASSVKEALAE